MTGVQTCALPILLVASCDLQGFSAHYSDLPPWSKLKFNPLGIYNLQHHIGVLAGEHGIFNRYQCQFDGANIAWFAAGCSQDNGHYIPADSFHPAFNIVQAHLPAGEEGGQWRKQLCSQLMDLLFDVVCHPFHFYMISKC